MDAGPRGQATPGRAAAQGGRAADRPGRPVEGGDDAAAGARDQAAPEGRHVPLSRGGDVGDVRHDLSVQDGRQDPAGIGCVAGRGQELLDLPEHGVGVAEPQEMVARLLEVAGVGQVFGQVAAVARRIDPVIAALDD